MKRIDLLDATARGVVVGRHAIWAPGLRLKLPFSWGGKLTKYGKSELGYDPADTIPHELAILRSLAEEGMAPPVGGLVYVETLISEHPGTWHADPCGAVGYEMWDANSLPPGRFSLERMRSLPIEGSDGAWGDIAKPGNVVNGYLVDVRRSAWDMLRWTGGKVHDLQMPQQNLAALRDRVHRECQFPPGARADAYQDFWLGGELERGQRRVIERAEAMGFRPQPGESVLDIGTQSGGFLQFAARAGADRLVGVDIDPGYIDCARALARSCGNNICFRRIDVVRERAEFLAWVRGCFPRGIDHLLCLSLEKHLGDDGLFALIDGLGARRTYVETNGIKSKSDLKLWPELQRRGAAHVGFTEDRSLRALYRIDRFAQTGAA
jgi:SAM-dependent methyltransferase